MSSEDEWFEEYTDRKMLEHLCLLEDHLLEMVRDPSAQCQACMFWHVFKIRSYASLECVKFSTGGHKEACIAISPFMDEIEAEMDKGLSEEKSLELAKGVREWRYKIAEFQGEDTQIEEVAVSSNPGIGGALVTGAGIGAGLAIGKKVLEKKENPGKYDLSEIVFRCHSGSPGHGISVCDRQLETSAEVEGIGITYLEKANPGNGGSNPHNPIALSVCEKKHGLGPKLERCIVKLEERNIEKGCPPMGLGTKKCPNPVAVCRASISVPVCPKSNPGTETDPESRNDWQEIAIRPYVARAIEVALIQKQSVKLIGHPDLTEPIVEEIRKRGLTCEAFSPCKCGYYGDPVKECTCTVSEIRKQQQKIRSHRADITLEIPRLEAEQILKAIKGELFIESETKMMERVKAAREFAFANGKAMDPSAESLLKAGIKQLHLDLPQVKSIITTATSIAKLDGSSVIMPAQIAEAMQYRPMREP